MKQVRLKINIGFVGKKIIIISVSAVILLILWSQLFNLLVTPSLNELLTSVERWKVAEQIYSHKEKNFAEFESNKERLKDMTSKENRYHLIPGTDQAPEALISMRQKLMENGIEETGFYIDPPEIYTPSGAEGGGVDITRQSVTVTGVGEYSAILDYINSVAHGEYFFKPNFYELTSRGSLNRNSIRLTAKYTLFVLKERSVLPGAEIEFEDGANRKNPFIIP